MSELVHSSLDQTLAIAKQELVQIENMVNDVVGESLESGNIAPAINFVNSLRSSVHVRGIALAKLLWLMETNWEEYGIDDEFVNVIESECGISAQTIRKYTRLWVRVFVNQAVPDEVKAQLLWWPIRRLLLISAAVGEGAVSDWDELLEAGSDTEVRQLVSGKVESRGGTDAINIILTRDGTLLVSQGDEVYEPFGSLNLRKTKENPAVEVAVNRIINNARVLEQ